MKGLVIPAALILLVSCGEKNEKKLPASQVPQSVVSAFTNKYPNASGAEWEQEKEDGKLVYEVDFKLNGKKVEAEFDTTGMFIKED